VSLDQSSMNNVSRVEVVFSRTPDLPASALGGSVNMISRSAFDANHLQFNYRVYTSMNREEMNLGASPGPSQNPTHKIKPGFDFTFLDPVNKRFGLTISYLYSDEWDPH